MLNNRKQAAVVTLVIVAACCVTAFAGSRLGLFDRLDQAYSEWSLRSRVKSLWEARVAGDLEKSNSFVLTSSDQPRTKLGNAVRYLDYEVKQMEIKGDEAEVRLEVMAQIDLPGLAKLPDEGPRLMTQRWVREGRTWYVDPGTGIVMDPALMMRPATQAPPDEDAPRSGEGE